MPALYSIGVQREFMERKMSKTGVVRLFSRGRSFASRWGRLFKFARTLDQVIDLMARFDSRQRKLEEAQSEIKALLVEAASKMQGILAMPDVRMNLASILDIKNLGYEIGRRLAEENLQNRPVQPDHTPVTSKLCTQDDFATDWLSYWCNELRTAPYSHRKIWELCYVAQVLFSRGQLSAGRRGIGFGCGEEPLPSLFAKYGARVLATDLAGDRPEAEVWRMTTQHADAIETIRRADICPDPELLANIEFQPVDMNAIPREFDGRFDFCWSTCALEHLGTLAKGLEFIENSVRTLRPGGIAVHTTEFTFNEGATIDNHPIVLYQRHHFEELVKRLQAAGHNVAEFDFNPGAGIMDRFIDLPPFFDNPFIGPNYAHLRLLFDGYTCTSIGIVITA